MTTTPKKDRTKRRRKTVMMVAAPVGALAFVGAGCEFAGLFLQLLLLFLGATPAANFGDTGQVGLNMVPVNEFGNVSFITNSLYEVEVTNPPRTDATVDAVDSKPASELGTFAVLLDSSSSMEESDPQRQRVIATQELSREVLERTPKSRMAIFDFGAGSSSGFDDTRTLTNFTSDVKALESGADKTIENGFTPLYDSLVEVMNSMESDVQATFQATPIDKAIVVVSDGEDTASTNDDLESVIRTANRLNIPVHVIGLAEASEFGEGSGTYSVSPSQAVTDLRRLANDTGGVYASVHSADDMVELAKTIALGLVGGYETTTVKLDPVPAPGTLVQGRIKLRALEDTMLGDSLGETISELGQWEFVAP